MKIRSISSFSNTGPRPENEDCIAVKQKPEATLMLVCDGMGGYDGGATSARIAVDILTRLFQEHGADIFSPQCLSQAYAEITQNIAGLELPGAGTTLAAVIYDGKVIKVVSTGDSRAYIFRNGAEVFVTHDDSQVQHLVDKREISREEARTHPRRNIITRCLTSKASMSGTPEVISFRPRDGDFLMLCTDGVWEAFKAEVLAAIFRKKETTDSVSTLLCKMLARHATDNHSAIIAKFENDSLIYRLTHPFRK